MKLQELKELALKATPDWKEHGDWYHDHRVGSPIHGNGDNDDNDAEYIAAANPQTILQLIERVEKLTEIASSLRFSMFITLSTAPILDQAQNVINQYGADKELE